MENKKAATTEALKFGKVKRVATSSKGGASISLTQKVSLVVDLDKHDTTCLPRQCQLLLNLLEVANGTVTMGDICKYFETSTEDMFWGKGKAYEQDCAKTTSFYSSKLLGNEHWLGKSKAHLNGIALIKLS
tara:strand:- start:241 stop:633 length:393 start_codon:yes stop_codon:yes gene_type:complete